MLENFCILLVMHVNNLGKGKERSRKGRGENFSGIQLLLSGESGFEKSELVKHLRRFIIRKFIGNERFSLMVNIRNYYHYFLGCLGGAYRTSGKGRFSSYVRICSVGINNGSLCIGRSVSYQLEN